MAEKTVSQEDVRKAWSAKAGKTDQYDLHEIETGDGKKQTQVIDKHTGSISVAVDGTGPEVLRRLLDHAGDSFIDGGESPVESTGAKSVKRYTSAGVLATPTQPEVMVDEQDPVEVNNKPSNKSDSQAKAPVDRQASTGAVQLTGDGGSKKFDDGSQSGPTTEGERARAEGISKTVAREQKRKGGNVSKADKAAAAKQQPSTGGGNTPPANDPPKTEE